jgi:SAM-dependent methyltransferase
MLNLLRPPQRNWPKRIFDVRPTMTRTPEALRHHFEVEKDLAARLRASRREERAELVPRLYAELYRRVPDHPRSQQSRKERSNVELYRSRMQLVKPFLRPDIDFLEFGAGDGGFCREVCPLVHRAVAVEVCEQGEPESRKAEGLDWVYYNGLALPLPDASFDVAFSYQVLEHVHPDDVSLHLRDAARILKAGGVYVLSTPHAFSGPHDISRHFTDKLETFHLKEWTYGELAVAMRESGFRRVGAYFKGRPRGALGLMFWRLVEETFRVMPLSTRKVAARRILNNVVIAAFR